MRTNIVAGIIGVVVLANAPVTPIATAAPPGLRCGTAITQDTTLSADLVGCVGDGLVVAADGITLDLHGYSILGDGVPHTANGIDAGIRVTDHRHVTITHGTVGGFDRGVQLEGGGHHTVSRLTGTSQAGDGIVTVNSTQNLLRHNTVHDNHGGIAVIGGSRNRIVDNVAFANREPGITLDGSDANVIAGNFTHDNGDNLILNGSSNIVTRNLVRHAVGCPSGCGYSITLELGRNNVIRDNTVENGLLDGIRIASFDPEVATVDNMVVGNVVRSSGLDGIAVGTTGDFATTGTVLRNNIVSNAAGDGIHVVDPATTVTGNVALRNGGVGINAVAGVQDGGRNRASGNGGFIQCVNVACRGAQRSPIRQGATDSIVPARRARR